MQWDTVPIMGRNSIPSLGDVGGRMGRSGGARRMHIQTLNIASGICTVVATVQESLWNPSLLRSLHRLQYPTYLVGVVITVEAFMAVAVEAEVIRTCHIILLPVQMDHLLGAT